MCGARVARDHHRLDPLREEPFENLQAVAPHRLGRLRAIRDARGIAEVDRRFAGEPLEDGARDGEPADARVEDADRRAVHRIRTGMLAEKPMPPPGTARISRSAGKSHRFAETKASIADATWLIPSTTSQSSRLRFRWSMSPGSGTGAFSARSRLRWDFTTMATAPASNAMKTAAVNSRPSPSCPRPGRIRDLRSAAVALGRPSESAATRRESRGTRAESATGLAGGATSWPASGAAPSSRANRTRPGVMPSRDGGSVWESNPPEPPKAPPTRF